MDRSEGDAEWACSEILISCTRKVMHFLSAVQHGIAEATAKEVKKGNNTGFILFIYIDPLWCSKKTKIGKAHPGISEPKMTS